MHDRRLKTAAAALLLLATPALAQISELSGAIPQAVTLTSDQRGEIAAFVGDHRDALLSGDARRVSTSREAVLRPLAGRTVSVAFRQAYADTLQEVIDALLETDSPAGRYAALRIAGALATDATARQVAAHLDDETVATRLFASAQLERTFVSANTPTPSISPAVARRIVDRLGATVATDPSRLVADAAVRALVMATKLTEGRQDEVRFHATRVLSDKLGERLRALDPGADAAQEIAVALRAVPHVRLAVTDVTTRPTPEAVRAAAGFAGDLIGYVFHRVELGAVPEDRSIELQAVQAGETLLGFALRRYGEIASRVEIRQLDLAGAFERGDDRTFRRDVVGLLGGSGELVQSLSFAADRFIR